MSTAAHALCCAAFDGYYSTYLPTALNRKLASIGMRDEIIQAPYALFVPFLESYVSVIPSTCLRFSAIALSLSSYDELVAMRCLLPQYGSFSNNNNG
jgi:hypothetical protein